MTPFQKLSDMIYTDTPTCNRVVMVNQLKARRQPSIIPTDTDCLVLYQEGDVRVCGDAVS